MVLGVSFGDKMDTFALPLSLSAKTGKVFYEIQVDEVIFFDICSISGTIASAFSNK